MEITVSEELAYSANVEGWEIRYFPEQGPTGCIMGGTFQDGTRFSIIVSTKYEWALALSNANWNLQKDGTTDVAAYVDRHFIASGKAAHLTNTIAVLPLTGVEPYRALQKGHRLDLQTPAGNLNFLLKGTGKAMFAVLDCVKTLVPNQQAPVPRQSARAAATPPADFQMVPLPEATVMLTNLFNAANIRGWSLQPPKQNDEWINFTLASGANGFFRAARGLGTRTADDHAAFVISKLSELCKGSFLSGKQSVASVDGSVVRKVVTTCHGDSKGDVATETTIIRQADGFLMELSHFMSTASPASSSATSDDPSKGDRAAMVDAALRLRDTK